MLRNRWLNRLRNEQWKRDHGGVRSRQVLTKPVVVRLGTYWNQKITQFRHLRRAWMANACLTHSMIHRRETKCGSYSPRALYNPANSNYHTEALTDSSKVSIVLAMQRLIKTRKSFSMHQETIPLQVQSINDSRVNSPLTPTWISLAVIMKLPKGLSYSMWRGWRGPQPKWSKMPLILT